jgi:hypothetical protein
MSPEPQGVMVYPESVDELVAVSRLRVDVIVLVLLVITLLRVAPGHGRLGWVLALVATVLVAAVVGVLGRRYRWHEAPHRASRSRGS